MTNGWCTYKYVLLFALLFVLARPSSAQLQVNTGISAAELATAIAGPGIQIQNPQITAASASYGSYSSSATSLPFNDGVLLTTGKAINAIGPNNVQHKSYINSFPGSTLLDSATGQFTNDACIFEFDIIPQGDTIKFNFTFASEEYNNFVGSIYSDVFGFFISGPGISGQENIALVPNTTQTVSINTINAATNSDYFFDNDNPEGDDLQYNGYTLDLIAKKAVTACETYHLTLVIADANDYSIDSGVFIEKIESPNASLSSATAGGIEYMVEGCNDGTITFTRLSSDLSQDIDLTFYVAGTAINGVDYTPQIGSDPDPLVPKSIQILSGESTSSIDISPVDDGIPNDDKYIAIYLASNSCPDIIYDSLFFPIFDSLIVTTSPDTAICFGQNLLLQTLAGGSAWSWSPSGSVSEPNEANTLASPDSTTWYVLESTASFCVGYDSTLVRVSDLALNIDSLKPTCAGFTDGMIQVSIDGGISPIIINWTGPNGYTNSGTLLSNLEAGNYNYEISDSIACTLSGTISIGTNEALSVSLNATLIDPYSYTVACNGDSSATIFSTVSGGTPEYQYLWSNGIQNTSFLTDQPAGSYSLLVIDSYNCFALDSIVITEPSPLSLTLDSIRNVTCFGENTGYIEVSASGGVLDYNYSWNTNPPTNGNSLSNSEAGTYEVTVFDGYGCELSEIYTISEPLEALSLSTDTIIDVECPGDNNGSITVSASGGTGPYTYQWNTAPIQTGPSVTNLTPGTYQVILSDSLGCTLIQNFTIGLLVNPLQANVSSKTNVACHGDSTGSAAITLSGGSGPFTYLWTPGNYTTSSVTGLSAGNYSVAINDLGSCAQSITVALTIDQPSDSISISLSSPLTNGFNLSCYQSNDGSISSTIAGGTSPYNIEWSGPNGFNSSSPNPSSLSAGLYTVLVEDQNNCSRSDTIRLTQPDEIIIDFVMTPATCPTPGSNDGSILLSVSGGVPAYTYSWTGPNGFVSNLEDITNLEAGAYTISVEDAINCIVSQTIIVTQPDNFVVTPTFLSYPGGWNVSCYSYSDGQVSVTLSGAALPVQYSWVFEGAEVSTDTFVTSASSGNYELIITDANNCIENRFYTLSEPDSILIDFNGLSNSISCYDGADGELSAAITGGTAAYSWLWTYPDNSTSTDEVIQNLSTGYYSLAITDVNNCLGYDSIFISQPDSLSISLSSPDINGYNVSCYNGSDGSIITSLNGGTPPYTYQWTYPGGGIGSSDQNPGNLQAGTYILLVSDANSCAVSDTITLTSPTPITYTTIISDYNGFALPCSGDTIASLEIVPQGGIPPYVVVWENGDTTTTMTGLGVGSYAGTIYDSSNCIGSFSVDITEPSEIQVDFTISSFPPNDELQCFEDSSGFIYAAISGGIPPYIISWTGPNSFSSASDSLIDLMAGDYFINIEDQNSCSYTNQITLTQPDTISISIDQLSFSTCSGDSASSLIAMASGGAGSFTYLWSGPNGYISDQPVIEDLGPGIYCAEVTDQNGCTNTECYEITDPTSIVISLSSPIVNGVNILCYGDSSGVVNSSVSGGIPPYTYIWNGPNGTDPTGTDPSGLIVGVYTLVISDSLGCEASSSIVLTQSMPIVNTIVSSSYNGFGVSCYGINDGSISISSSNGLSPYTYSWSDEMGSIVGNDSVNNLQAGFYYVETSDANACTSLDTIQLTSPDSILISLSSQEYYPGVNISCNNGANGTIESIITGGIEDYSYSWIGPDGFVSNESDPVQLSAGWYTLSLSDQNACVAIDSIQLLEPDSALTVEYTYSVQNSGSNISCFGGSDGSVSIHISGGIPNYQVYWLGPNGFSSNDTLIENLVAGIYFLSIVDSASCTYSEQIVLTQPLDSLSTNITLENNSCFGDNSAFILVEGNGGSPPYAIDWQGPDLFTSSDFLIEDLSNGSYSYMLSDTNGCMLFDTLQISSEAEIEANETQQNSTCVGASDGSISIEPSGGGSFYIYLWTGPDGFTSSQQNISGLDTGLYCVEIVSDLFCSASFCYTITDPEAIEITTFSPVYDNGYNISSFGNNDGSISITSITGGTPIFTIEWNGPDGFSANSVYINDLISGEYLLEITDENNCIALDTIYLSQPESTILPTGFTPNRDGYNDLYVVPGINSLNPASIKIYNRWGDLVFESANYANDWDGIGKNGGNLPEGTYFVIVEFEKDNKTLNGYIDLRR